MEAADFTAPLTSFTRRHVVDGGSFLWSVASGSGRLVAVGTGGKILTSSDGQTWAPSRSGTSEWLVGATYGAGNFVVVGDHGIILTSRDGQSWSQVAASGTARRLNNVLYAAGIFVAIGEGGTIVTSPDGLIWTAQASGVTTWLRALSYEVVPYPGRSRFRISGETGLVLSSANGLTWERVALPANAANGKDIEAFAGSTGIGQDGTLLNHWEWATQSADQINYPGIFFSLEVWSYSTTGIPARFRGLISGRGAWFATGEGGTIAAAPSSAGPWSPLATSTSANLVSGVFHGNTLYVVGENETILQSDPLYSSRLANLSTRGVAGGGSSAMFSGFVVTGSAPKQVLLRAVGPALGAFGVPNPLAAPSLTLFDGANQPLAANSGWDKAANANAINVTARRLGAFNFAPGSADSALLVTLSPGVYTTQVASRSSDSGIALVEAYDVDPLSDEETRAINISTRGFVGQNAEALIAGFRLAGYAPRRLLIRAVGPGLAQFGLTGLLAAPQIQVYDSYGYLHPEFSAGAWSRAANADELRAASAIAGAFPLPEGSTDAVVVASFNPASYTVQVTGVGRTSGLALVEIYDLP